VCIIPLGELHVNVSKWPCKGSWKGGRDRCIVGGSVTGTLRGPVLLSRSPENHPEAESSFHPFLAIARRHQAKSWELRAATSLACLWQQQGKRQEAYELRVPV